MVDIRVDGDELVVEPMGIDKVLAMKGTIRIPLQHVKGATRDPGMVNEPKGRRWPGTHIPGVIVAGDYIRDREKTFWDVKDKKSAIVIQLADEEYERLVVQVADPAATVEAIESAIRHS